ncbi:MAG: hypothetical protein E6Q71_01920 [Pseudomonas sp.]|nr:MAG: hypothetical protein E6Q71_01920 [Pseudomonas sp.]
MRQRPRASALKVPKPHFGKSRLRDYLYYQLNLGDRLESPNGAIEQLIDQESPCLNAYEIGLIAATQVEADRFLGCIAGAMHKHLPKPAKHRLTAYGLDQAWRPQQPFDEVHWFQGRPTCPPPQELLACLGNIVHIHFFEQSDTKPQPGFRTYHWRSVRELTEFLASLSLSREVCGFLALDWESYFMWQPHIGCIATVSSGWGSTPKAAADALLASADVTDTSSSGGEILIIEGGVDTLIGDYVYIVSALEQSFEFDFVTTGWGSINYSGYGLKLLRFSHR